MSSIENTVPVSSDVKPIQEDLVRLLSNGNEDNKISSPIVAFVENSEPNASLLASDSTTALTELPLQSNVPTNCASSSNKSTKRSKGKENSIQCPLCNQALSSKQWLKFHLKNKHPTEFKLFDEVFCNSNDRSTFSSENLSTKYKPTYTKSFKPRGKLKTLNRSYNPSYICHVCDLTFGSRTVRDEHMDRKHREKITMENSKYACTFCDFESINLKKMESHFGLDGNDKPGMMSCFHCKQNYSLKMILKINRK